MSSWPVLAALLRLGLVRARTVLRTGRRSRQASAPKAVLVLTAWLLGSATAALLA